MDNNQQSVLPISNREPREYMFITGGTTEISLNANQIYSLLMSSPVDNRLQTWLDSWGEQFEHLTKRIDGLTLDKLAHNNSYQSLFIRATILAIQTHQQEKLNALRNILLNAALPDAPEDDLQYMFLQLVEEFTPWHIKLLDFFSGNWVSQLGYSESTEVDFDVDLLHRLAHLFPQLQDKTFFTTKIVKDLTAERLFGYPKSVNMLDGVGVLGGKYETYVVSELGHAFLNMIETPLPLKGEDIAVEPPPNG